MARLQILELPEGAGDDRPPFVLVIDQAPRDETSSAFRRDLEDNKIAASIGARHVLVFEDTIEIPASEPPPLAEIDDPERAGTTQLVYAHERTRLDLCDALLVSRDTTWRKLIEAVAERQRELAAFHRKLDGKGDAELSALVLNATGIDITGRSAPDYRELLATACRTVIQSENARARLRSSTDKV